MNTKNVIPALEVRDLKKCYGSVAAVRGIDFRIMPGDFFALLGPNGAGKSTTIGIIAGLVTKSAGTVRVGDADLDADPSTVRRRLGLVPQEFNFNVFETCRDILIQQGGYYGVPLSVAAPRADELLALLGLTEKRRVPARNLSGGMKRRLMIARALIHNPQILILDEPTAGVDIEIRRSMWAFLKDINRKGTTIILTTHYLDEVEQLCRHVAVINKGLIVRSAPIEDFLGDFRKQSYVLQAAEAIRPEQLEPLPFPSQLSGSKQLEVVTEGDLGQVFQLLAEQGIRVQSLRPAVNRIEQIFLDLVTEGEAS